MHRAKQQDGDDEPGVPAPQRRALRDPAASVRAIDLNALAPEPLVAWGAEGGGVPIQTHQQQQDTPTTGTQGDGATLDALGNRAARAKGMAALRTWISGQQAALSPLDGAARTRRIEAVLATLEQTWARVRDGAVIDVSSLPTVPTAAPGEPNRLPLPPELIGVTRPLITMLEAGTHTDTAGGPEASAHSGVDWNSRLGVPEYRTQSDNLAGPEATCNTTTLSMVMERLGIGREDIVRAIERRIQDKWIRDARRKGVISAARASELSSDRAQLDEEAGWDRDAEWKAASRRYVDSVMKDKSYQRIRGQASVSKASRDDIAGEMRERGQMEDLLDMLVRDAGLSRYGIVSEPGRVMGLVSNTGIPPKEEKLWGGTAWKTVRDRTRATLEAGGAAALSFKHKGTRDRGATHIVAVQEVRDDGFVIDDPYGQIRESYDPKGYDDAYFHADSYQQRDRRTGRMVTKERLIHERSVQKNEGDGFDDWGVGAARSLQSNESKGRDSFISKSQIEKAMHYLTLFQRGVRVPIPRARPEGLGG